MKQYVTVLITIAIIIALNFWQNSYLSTTSKYLLSDIMDIQNCIARKDFKATKESIDELENTWKIVKPSWDIFGEHDDIEKIEEHIVSMKIYVLYENVEELNNQTGMLEYAINHVIQAEKLSIGNVL